MPQCHLCVLLCASTRGFIGIKFIFNFCRILTSPWANITFFTFNSGWWFYPSILLNIFLVLSINALLNKRVFWHATKALKIFYSKSTIVTKKTIVVLFSLYIQLIDNKEACRKNYIKKNMSSIWHHFHC